VGAPAALRGRNKLGEPLGAAEFRGEDTKRNLKHVKESLRGSLKRGAIVYPSRLTPSRTAYDTDLTDTEWASLVPLVPPTKGGGRPPKHSRREILNGIFYAVRSGAAWKLLPHDLPPWRTVYHYFWCWRRSGVWQQIHDRLREQVPEAAGRNPNPSAVILDSSIYTQQ
jgi:transposase